VVLGWGGCQLCFGKDYTLPGEAGRGTVTRAWGRWPPTSAQPASTDDGSTHAAAASRECCWKEGRDASLAWARLWEIAAGRVLPREVDLRPGSGCVGRVVWPGRMRA
jgi:hypothetical protein